MTYIDDLVILYNLQVWFRQNRLDLLENSDKVWTKEFAKWLQEQGCEIDYYQPYSSVLRNGLGIAPGYDRLMFADSSAATWFVLRWS